MCESLKRNETGLAWEASLGEQVRGVGGRGEKSVEEACD